MDNRCQIYTYFGSPGSGKSTFAAQLCRKYSKKGYMVFSNFYIKGAYIISPQTDLGKYNIEHAIIIIDEAGCEFNNRAWSKNFSDPEVLFWWKTFRHYHVQIHVYSQGWNDCDVKIRTLSTSYWYVHRTLIPFVFAKSRIHKSFGINQTTEQPDDKYKIDNPILNIFTQKYIFGPFYWKLFDSFEKRKLPDKEWIKW